MSSIALAGCAILKGESILLLHRIKNDRYEMPGGKQELNESLEDTAHRELREEIGCEVTILRKLGQDQFVENGREFEYHWFLAQIQGEKDPSIQEPQTFSKLEYVPFSKIENYSLSNNMRQFWKFWKQKNN